jgi:signal peptidase I
MQPTFNPEGNSEWVLVEKLSYKWLHKYTRGDVAVLWYEAETILR